MVAHSLPRAAHPNALEFGTKRVTIGCQACALLAIVLASGGSARVVELSRTVWGEEDGPRGRLDSMLNRLNAKLAAVGCDVRLSVDGAIVVIV